MDKSVINTLFHKSELDWSMKQHVTAP